MTDALTRRAALGAIAAAVAAPAAALGAQPALLSQSTADPAFAAIERHKAAVAAFDNFVAQFEDSPDPMTPDEQAACDKLEDAEYNALFDLADTVPTTEKGANAALAYLVREAGTDQRRVLGIFSASLIAAKWSADPCAPSPSVAQASDAT